jgi:phosphate transport system ATP-binding protein
MMHSSSGQQVSLRVGPSANDPDPTLNSTVLEVRKLSVFYGAHCALDEVSLNIATGHITALVGPSGCGKTTFLSSLNRIGELTPGWRCSGHIGFDSGNLLDRRDLLVLRRQIGMVFQRPNPFPLSIWRNLDLPLREHGIQDRHERAARIESVLRLVGLWKEVADRLNASALSLSGGQAQRLCIARAVALTPEVLLMDEPCSALDPQSTARIEQLILQLRETLSIVMVTHNLAQARRLADDTAVFWTNGAGGQIIEANTTQALFHNASNPFARAYLAGERG